MTDVSASSIAIKTGAVGLAMLLPGIDSNALIGAFAGATLFVMSAKELSILFRMIYLFISVTMGYKAAPEIIANTFIEQSAVAGFIAGLLCVTIALVLIERIKDVDLKNLFKRG
ncbi:MAG: hypothetical protein AXW15_02300 [Neptuniibacter sp. Phe_28]|jgi:hypothetical protein|nr:MAG: hypothetical protein AXW15_02300 [Neptuniibacter sp. Phe_28]